MKYALLAIPLLAQAAQAQVIFADDFDAGPSPEWSNLRGNWTASGGVYFAQAPTNSPPTATLLPYVVADCDIDVDIRRIVDGGVWVHVDETCSNGVLLVTGGDGQQGQGFYWHTVTNNSYSGALSHTPPLFTRQTDVHVRVSVRGDTYSLYFNGGVSPVSTVSTSAYPEGRVGLYDYATQPDQAFDNFVLRVPCLPDYDENGVADQDDVAYLINVISGGDNPTGRDPDFDANGVADQDDIAALIDHIAGAACP